jgi:hypothetical protein
MHQNNSIVERYFLTNNNYNVSNSLVIVSDRDTNANEEIVET